MSIHFLKDSFNGFCAVGGGVRPALQAAAGNVVF